jgi:diguanylate cyclase (GGDEF)-like protein
MPVDDCPDLPHARQLKTGIPWLSFDAPLEAEFRQRHLAETLVSVRTNLCLAICIAIAFSAMDAIVLGQNLNRIPSLLHILVIVPTLLIVLAASFSPQRDRIYQPLTSFAVTVYGLSHVVIQLIASAGGVPFLFPSLLLATMYIYFLAGLMFYNALAANVIVLFLYIAAETALRLTNSEFSYNALALVSANLVGASVAYLHERTSRLRFLEAGLLREMVARDGLTGIQNRRMFDQHIQRAWQQAVRDEQQIAILLVDIDCFKSYNDRYGHQAGDECLRAVAHSLTQCARRPMDFVARYGGEEFAVVLYEASQEYVAEVLTRIQRSIAELNIPHEASDVASRLTVSIGAAFIRPTAGRTPEGLIQLADEALYTAKEQGRNRVMVMEAEYHTLRTGRFNKRRGQAAAPSQSAPPGQAAAG